MIQWLQAPAQPCRCVLVKYFSLYKRLPLLYVVIERMHSRVCSRLTWMWFAMQLYTGPAAEEEAPALPGSKFSKAALARAVALAEREVGCSLCMPYTMQTSSSIAELPLCCTLQKLLFHTLLIWWLAGDLAASQHRDFPRNSLLPPLAEKGRHWLSEGEAPCIADLSTMLDDIIALYLEWQKNSILLYPN